MHVQVPLQLNSDRGDRLIVEMLLTLLLHKAKQLSQGLSSSIRIAKQVCTSCTLRICQQDCYNAYLVCTLQGALQQANEGYLHEVWFHLQDLLQAKCLDIQHIVQVHLTSGSFHNLSCTIDLLHSRPS